MKNIKNKKELSVFQRDREKRTYQIYCVDLRKPTTYTYTYITSLEQISSLIFTRRCPLFGISN